MLNWALPKDLDVYSSNLFESIKEYYKLGDKANEDK